ncbi:tetratricopeptide repeat protein [Alphaproteobacteria bacterium LSUCC0684]
MKTMRIDLRGLLSGLALCLMLSGASLAEGRADESNAQLNALFHDLAEATTETAAAKTIHEIWQIWTGDSENSTSKVMMEHGLTLMQAGNFKGAERVFTQLIEREPDYMEAWNKRATVRYMLSNLTGSEEDIAEVLVREPRHFGALSGLAMIRLKRGNMEEALKLYRHILTINPFSPDALRLIPEIEVQLRGDPA